MKKIAANRNYKVATLPAPSEDEMSAMRSATTNWRGTSGEAHAEGANTALDAVLRELKLEVDLDAVQSILSGLLARGFSLVVS